MSESQHKISIPGQIYRQFDADIDANVPAQHFKGWQHIDVPIAPAQTALVLMHVWDMGTAAEYPGWYRHVEYIPRAQKICQDVLPGLLDAVRSDPDMQVMHVVSGGDYYKQLPGFKRAEKLSAGASSPLARIAADPVIAALRRENHPAGAHNLADIKRGFANLDFAPQARPIGDEGIAENGEQLFALCRASGINHLIYAGFAINWCLLLDPGGMADMHQRGLTCSALRQAVTAVENHESAANELHKQSALWRVGLAFGFVFDVDLFVAALQNSTRSSS